MKLLIAIHDVTPAFADESRELWDRCTEHDVVPALFVVPNWHGEWPVECHPRFASWLRARARDGADIFVHGDRHDEMGTTRRWHDHLRAFGRTAGEGEFLTLHRDEARRRIRRGIDVLNDIGLRPAGFVAPAWLYRPAARSVAEELGLAMSEDDHAVYLHGRAMYLPSPVVRWSARTRPRAVASAVVAPTMCWLHRGHWLVRIALHPTDLHHNATRRSAMETVAWWRARRHPWRYSDL